MNQDYLSPSLLMSPPPPPKGLMCPAESPMQKEPPSPCRSRGRAVAAKAAGYLIPRPPAWRLQPHCAKAKGASALHPWRARLQPPRTRPPPRGLPDMIYRKSAD